MSRTGEGALVANPDSGVCCYVSATAVLIYARNPTNTFSLNGSLIMFNKKGLNGIWYSKSKSRGRSVEGLLSFKKPSDTHLVHELFSFNVTFVKS